MEIIVGATVAAFAGPFLKDLLANIAADGVQATGAAIHEWSIKKWGGWFNKNKQAKLIEFMQQFGELSPSEIEKLIRQAEKQNNTKLTTRQRSDVKELLVSFAQGIKNLTTQGCPGSAWLRSEDVLRQLLEGMQLARKRGETVGAGYEQWILEDFLGRGAFGEVWSARFEGAGTCPFSETGAA